jgi:hypothetical protein
MLRKISPSRLIMLDAIGATISGLLWWLLIGTNPDVFGIAAPIPWLLGSFALLFSWLGWFHEFLNLSSKKTLLILILLNTAFCIGTLLLILTDNAIINWGIAFSVGEIVIVMSLVIVEWRAIRSAQE